MAAVREVLTEHFPNIDHEVSDYISSKTVDPSCISIEGLFEDSIVPNFLFLSIVVVVPFSFGTNLGAAT